MLESGIALIAVNMPSLRAFSISLNTGEIIRSVRSLIELSFLRGSSTDIAQNAPDVPTTSGTNECGKAGSFSTRPSEGSIVPHEDIPLSFPDDPERQDKSITRGY